MNRMVVHDRTPVAQGFSARPLSPKEIADMLGRKPGAVRKLLHTMAKAGEVNGIGGCYRLPLTPGNTGNTGNASENCPELRGEMDDQGVTGHSGGGNTGNASEGDDPDALPVLPVAREGGNTAEVEKPLSLWGNRPGVTGVTGVTGESGNTEAAS